MIKLLKLRARGKHAEVINCGSHQLPGLWRQGLLGNLDSCGTSECGGVSCCSAQASVAFCKSVPALKPLWEVKKAVRRVPPAKVIFSSSCHSKSGYVRLPGSFQMSLFLLKWSPCAVQVAKKNHDLLYQLKIFFFPLSILSFSCWRV